MNKYSQTYIGILVSLLGSLLPRIGVEIGSEDLTITVSVLVTIAGSIWAFWGRFRKGDISALGVKK